MKIGFDPKESDFTEQKSISQIPSTIHSFVNANNFLKRHGYNGPEALWKSIDRKLIKHFAKFHEGNFKKRNDRDMLTECLENYANKNKSWRVCELKEYVLGKLAKEVSGRSDVSLSQKMKFLDICGTFHPDDNNGILRTDFRKTPDQILIKSVNGLCVSSKDEPCELRTEIWKQARYLIWRLKVTRDLCGSYPKFRNLEFWEEYSKTSGKSTSTLKRSMNEILENLDSSGLQLHEMQFLDYFNNGETSDDDEAEVDSKKKKTNKKMDVWDQTALEHQIKALQKDIANKEAESRRLQREADGQKFMLNLLKKKRDSSKN